MNKNCKIEWNTLNSGAWDQRFNTIRRSSILQCYEYAQALCPINQQSARWGLIKINGAEAGLVQLMEVSLLKQLFHVVMLDRGPLWFDGFGEQDDLNAFFTEYNRIFKPRLGRRRRIMPETSLQISHAALPAKRKFAYPAYQTIWVDLKPDEAALRAKLHGNWRSSLSKAERSGVQLHVDKVGLTLSWLLDNYARDKAERKFQGPKPRTIIALCDTFAPRGNRLLMQARFEGQPIAGILIFIHGKSATYQIGWTDHDKGRKYNAHNFLLWQAMLHLKALGIEDLDLGGVNGESAKGVKKFKMGMGGELVELCGQYK
jgi:lipid II:glycine glycyltransferase (peptidoglycan interpeptide bridge formation enzyme)